MNAPRRVLFVENGIGYGGAIICLRHLARNLDRDRYQAMIITGRTSPQYQEIQNDASWVHIRDRHLDTVGMGRALNKQAWLDNIPGARMLTKQLVARLDDLGNFLPFFLHLLWTAWRFKPDLIHANNEPLCNRASLLVAKILGVPSVCHVRGDQDGSRLMRWAFGLVDHFVPVSHWVDNSIQHKLGIASAKTTVVYDGIELNKLDPNISGQGLRSRFGVTDEDFAVGLVGLLIPWKGQEIFLDAAKILKDRIPRLKMLIVGGTPEDCKQYEASLRSRTKAEGLTETVLFTGHNDDMPRVYNALDIVISASTSPEPLGTVVIEAMAIGRPLIGPRHGGAAEMMEHQKTGLLFEPRSAESLADAIETFYRDTTLRDSCAKAARAHALETFAVARHVDEICAVYDGLLTEKQG